MFPAASGLIFEHRKAPPPIRKQGFGSAAHRHGGVIAKEIAYAPSKLRMLSRYQPPDIRAYQAHSWTWSYKFLGSGNSHKQQQVRAGIPVSGCVAGEIELASAQSRTPCGFPYPAPESAAKAERTMQHRRRSTLATVGYAVARIRPRYRRLLLYPLGCVLKVTPSRRIFWNFSEVWWTLRESNSYRRSASAKSSR